MKQGPALLALCLVTASCAPKPAAEPVAATPISAARIVAIAVSDDSAGRSWSPEGKPLDEWVVPKTIRNTAKEMAKPDERSIILRFHVDGPDMPSVAFRQGDGKVEPASVIGENFIRDPNDPKRVASCDYYAYVIRKVDVPQPFDLTALISSGRWQSVSTYTQSGGKFALSTGKDIGVEVRDDGAKSATGRVTVTVQLPGSPLEHAYRLVATGTDGKPLMESGSIAPMAGSTTTEYWFLGKASDIASVELQSRDYEQRPILGIYLQPQS